MPFRIITIPFDEGRECFLEDELTRFCLNKRIPEERLIGYHVRRSKLAEGLEKIVKADLIATG